MGRLGLRVLMAAVGVSVLAFYVVAATLTYWALLTFWLNRPPLSTTLLLIGGLTLVFGYLSYQFGTSQLLANIDATELPRRKAPWLYRRTDRLADRMDVEEPRLLVADLQLPNALSLGSARGGVIVVDRSLFRLLDADELEAILAHEFAHLESRDGLVQTLAYSVLRTVVGLLTVGLLPLVLFTTGLARSLAWIRGRPARWSQSRPARIRVLIGQAVALLLFGFTALLRAHSRRREFAADDRAADVTGNPVALARALSKIDRITDPDWGLLSPLYTRGDEDGSLGEILSTHPATDERIERLVERARRQRGQPRTRSTVQRPPSRT